MSGFRPPRKSPEPEPARVPRPLPGAQTCGVCGKAFEARREGQETCCRLCRDRAKVKSRTLILDRDGHTCGLCNLAAGREAKPMPPQFLRVILVDPKQPATARNLVTACRSCAGRYEGLKLGPAVESAVISMNEQLNAECGLKNGALLPEALG